jgi:hypothetical protein
MKARQNYQRESNKQAGVPPGAIEKVKKEGHYGQHQGHKQYIFQNRFHVKLPGTLRKIIFFLPSCTPGDILTTFNRSGFQRENKKTSSKRTVPVFA